MTAALLCFFLVSVCVMVPVIHVVSLRENNLDFEEEYDYNNTLLQEPDNVAVVIGKPVNLFCGRDTDVPPNSYIVWDEYITFSPNPFTIIVDDAISDGPNRRRYYAELSYQDNDTLLYNFTISPIQVRDAGLYSCSKTYRGKNTFIHVVVLDSDPVCTTNITADQPVRENDYVIMTCEIGYHGAYAPMFRWRAPPCAQVEVLVNATDDVVTSSIIFKANTWLNGSNFLCDAMFEEPRLEANQSDYATNAPDYVYTWGSPPITVLGTNDLPPNYTSPGDPCTSVSGHWTSFPSPDLELLISEHNDGSLLGWFRIGPESNWRAVDGWMRREEGLTGLVLQAVASGDVATLTLNGECFSCQGSEEHYLDLTSVTRTHRWDDLDGEDTCLPDIEQEVSKYRFKR